MRQLLSSLLLLLSINFLQAQNSVGIGTTTPSSSAQLDIVSPSNNKGLLIPRLTSSQRTAISSPANGLLVYETTTNSFWYYNSTSLSWIQLGTGGGSASWTTSGTHIYNNNTGNVGIGITAPTAKLHLAGLMKIDGGQIDIDDNIAQVRLLDGGSPKGYFKHSQGNIEVGTNVGSNPDGKLNLETLGSPRLTILPDGNVGIGSIVPSEKLYVNGNIKNTGNLLTEGYLAVDGNSILYGDVTGVLSANFLGNINSNTGMSINDPAGTLTLKTGTTDKGFVQLSGDDLRVGTYSSNTTGKFVIRTGGDDQVFVDQNGNMGFDIAAPLTRIHIPSGSDASLTSHGYLMLGPVTGSNIVIDNNEIVARSNGAIGNLVLQNDGGTVRIGSVAVPSGYKFAINGKMICEELKVKLASSGWPDYVFANGYKLKSLPQLEKYIQQNKHLPNIPSAAEVEKNGIEVGDMQKKMMEKIEELTLYIIDLQKQIDELKKKTSGN